MNSFFMPKLKNFSMEYIEKQIEGLKSISLKYRCALREIETKIEILNDEYASIHDHNPIEHIKSRIKSPESIIDKFFRKGLPFSPKSTEYLTDIAGVRVTCSFIGDVYKIADSIKSQNDITVIKEKDYIKNPKANGYRSLHLVVSVPVFFSNSVENVPVEIQLRTVSMDTWASIEHKLRYKYNGKLPDDINEMLLDSAKTTARLDEEMMMAHDKLIN